MFHVARNEPERGTSLYELVAGAADAVRMALPPSWAVSAVREPVPTSGYRPDLLIELTGPDGTSSRVVVEAKRVLEPRDVPGVLNQARRFSHASGAGAAIVATTFVSPLAKEHLTEAGLGWYDPTGNLRLHVDRPAVFLERIGAVRNPFRHPEDRRLKSLRGPGAARVVRELCKATLPIGVRALAAQANVGVATSARVLDLLDREGVLRRGDSEEVIDVHKRSLVRRWTQDYGLMTSNDVTAMLDPRGVEHTVKALRSSTGRYAVTGSVAARTYLPGGIVPVTPLTTVIVHAARPTELAYDIGLRTVDRGANVFLVHPFDDMAMDDARMSEGLYCVAPAQAVSDLLTGPGRSSEEADQLMSVLAGDDRGWSL